MFGAKTTVPESPRIFAVIAAAFVLGGSVLAAGVRIADTSSPAIFRSEDLLVKLEPREVILPAGAQGLNYFPDLCFSLIHTNPVRALLAVGVSTWLLEGKDMRSLQAVGKVLAPGLPHSFDNGYAGISSVVRDEASGQLLAFYHAEDQEERPRNAAGVPGFYCSVALAISKDQGRSFEKIGPVLTSALPKRNEGTFDQGCGEASVTLDRDGQFLLAFYVDHSRIEERGVQICLARSPREQQGRPGTWLKYRDGNFSEPGLGGKDTPVVSAKILHADAIFPQVSYVSALGKYVMMFNINAYRELNEGRPPQISGLYVACSDDGVHWSKPLQLLAAPAICRVDQEVVWHPTLVVDEMDARNRTAKGWLYYSYSEHWGHRSPQEPHHLVGHRILIQINPH